MSETYEQARDELARLAEARGFAGAETPRQKPAPEKPRTGPRVWNMHHGKPDAGEVVYCGRSPRWGGSPLGNPFKLEQRTPQKEAEVIGKYRRWLRGKIEQRDAEVLAALDSIQEDGWVGCTCAPRPCHGNVIVQAWHERRASLAAQAEGARAVCPVGCCHPSTGLALPVDGPGELCQRHYRKLSPALSRQLAVARKIGGDELRRQLDEAVREARRLDDHWHDYLLAYDGGVVGFERSQWPSVVRRWHELRDEGAAIISGKLGRQLTVDNVDAYSPHEVVAADEQVIGSGSTLAKAVTSTSIRFTDESGRNIWPGGAKPTVVNVWTGERMSLAAAIQKAARGHIGQQ